MGPFQASDIGKKVTIRLLDIDGYRDLVGHLTSPNTLKNRHGQIVEFDTSKIHIWREIQPVPRTATSGAPLSTRIYELERALNKTWRAKDETLMDGWILRADLGITKRANSALVLSHGFQNEADLNDAIDKTIGWYRERDLIPTLHIIPTLHQLLEEKLDLRGFSDSLDALVMVKDHKAIPVNFDYEVSDSPSQAWLAAQGDQEISELLQRTPAKYLSINDGGKTVAVGRIGFADGWAVLSRIWVSNELRGMGLGRKILSALEAEADLSKIALQVASNNEVAINLYESFGYQIHHNYRFKALPQRIDLIQDLCC
ncbi:MAG: GNAT family N-acetyltransferase [Candidatus Nanopelagicaceae bacterium]